MGLMQSNDPRAIRSAKAEAQQLYDSSISRNTRINYKSDIRCYQRMGFPLPAYPEDISKYLATLAKTYNPRSLERHLKALRFWHKINDFIDPTDHVLVKRMLKGIKNTYGKPLKKAKAFTVEDIATIDAYYKREGTVNAARNNCLIQLGFFGAFRRSEVVGLNFEDLEFSEDGVKIKLRRSKTDQTGEGYECALPYMKGTLCPVRTLEDWLRISKIDKGALFPSLSYMGRIISSKSVSVEVLYTVIKDVVKKCGISEPEKYSGHSLRRGFATEAAKRGVAMHAIMKHGRWEHVGTVNGYIEEATKFTGNAASALEV